MGWKLFDYIDPRGRNLVTEWLDDLPHNKIRGRVKAKLEMLVKAELGLLPGAVTDTHERSIKEIVINGRFGAFRIFTCRGPDNPKLELTLLCGGEEKDKQYVDTSPTDAEQHRQNLINGQGTRREHEYFQFLG